MLLKREGSDSRKGRAVNRAQPSSDRADCAPRVGGASRPRSERVSEGGALRGAAPGAHAHASYAGRRPSLVYKSMLSVRREASPFTSTRLEPLRGRGAVFNP